MQDVSGLVQGEEVKIETTFSLWMRPRLEGLEFRFPLTIGPRYTRGDEGMRGKKKNPLESTWDPGYRFGMNLLCLGVGKPESETFLVKTEALEDGYRLTLDDVYPDQDCVVKFPLIREDGRTSLQVNHYREGDRTWFIAMAVPPQNPLSEENLEAHGREIIVLMDRSGSMTGPKWLAATEALKGFLSRLDDRDYLNIGFFDNQTLWLFEKPGQANREAVDQCLRSLDMIDPKGGTELGVALEQALKMRKTRKNLARHVLIVTDAQVSDSERIYRLVEEQAKGSDPRKVSIICIDSAPNAPLATGIAERGRGAAFFLTSDPEEDEMALALEEIFRSWSRPIVRGLLLEAEGNRAFDSTGFLPAGKRAGRAFIELGDLPSEKPVFVCGCIDGLRDPGKFTLKDSGGNFLADSWVSAAGSRPVRRLCGAVRVRRLEALLGSRYGNEDLDKIFEAMGFESLEPSRPLYSENQLVVGEQKIKNLQRSESLAAGVVSVETSFVAVSIRGDARVNIITEVPNALPRGWDAGFANAGEVCFRMAAKSGPKRNCISGRSNSISDFALCECKVLDLSLLDPNLFELLIRSGDIKTVEALLNRDPGIVDKELSNGLRPIEIAISSKNKNMVELLLQEGASLELARPKLMEWVVEAVAGCDESMVDVLLEFGVDPNSIYRGETLLMLACSANAGPAIIHSLICSGADVNARDRDGVTVLMKAAVRCGDLEILKMLLDAGADPCIRSSNGKTAFHCLLENKLFK